LPFLALSRTVGARDQETYRFEREFALPRALDRGLEKLMTIERALIAYGIPLGIGASLLLVARSRT
jgi:hypothetical protein